MCETFPPNQREACDIPRASIKVGAENRLRSIWSAFAAHQRLVLGQVKVADKSNEIVAIPSCSTAGRLSGIVTIDAIGCQRDIAEKSHHEGRLRAGAQRQSGTLREDVELFAAEQKAVSFKDAKVTRQQTVDGDHGRIETRTTTAIHDVGWLQQRHQWPGLQGVVMVESTGEIANRIERETRFYITSLAWLADQLGPVIRSHWAIGVSREGHAVMSVKVRPEPKDSGSEAREALWRESKTAEPSDNILERSMREASGCNVQ